MAVKLNSTGGGSVTLDSPSTASNYTVTLPSAAGTLATTTGTGSVFTNPTINGFTGDTSAITIGTTQFVKDTSGNVGIGTATPATKLTVAGNVLLSSAGNIFVQNNGGIFFNGYNNYGSGLYSDSLGTTLKFQTSAVDRLTLDASGNLGLGVTPSTGWTLKALQIGGFGSVVGDSNTIAIGQGYYGSPYTGFGTYYATTGDPVSCLRIAKTTTPFIWQVASAGTAGNAITWTQAMTLDTSGRLIVGDTTTRQSSAGEFTSNSLAPALLARTNVASDESQYAFQVQKYTTTNTTSQIFVRFLINNGATASGYITANGANAATFTSSSDSRLKENITVLPNQLANICALKPSEFDYKDGSGHQIGFIAQEMQEVYPDVVGEGEDGMLTITGWSKTEARLVKAIQELSAQNNALEARLAQLEAK